MDQNYKFRCVSFYVVFEGSENLKVTFLSLSKRIIWKIFRYNQKFSIIFFVSNTWTLQSKPAEKLFGEAATDDGRKEDNGERCRDNIQSVMLSDVHTERERNCSSDPSK